MRKRDVATRLKWVSTYKEKNLHFAALSESLLGRRTNLEHIKLERFQLAHNSEGLIDT